MVCVCIKRRIGACQQLSDSDSEPRNQVGPFNLIMIENIVLSCNPCVVLNITNSIK